jgi:hypothetical protein
MGDGGGELATFNGGGHGTVRHVVTVPRQRRVRGHGAPQWKLRGGDL